MTILQYCVKAFTDDLLLGNPAAVVTLTRPLAKSMMQRIAFINGFPETVFLLGREDQLGHHDIWWFTPQREVFNAGHATLAAQFVLSQMLPCGTHVTLRWDGIDADRCSSTFSRDAAECLTYDCSPDLQASGTIARQFGVARAFLAGLDAVVVLDSESDIVAFTAPLAMLASLPLRGLCVTAAAEHHDYCARFFAPAYGVSEDLVTASAHQYLARYWASRLGKRILSATQCSQSPGTLTAEVTSNGVKLKGTCRLFSTTHIHL